MNSEFYMDKNSSREPKGKKPIDEFQQLKEGWTVESKEE